MPSTFKKPAHVPMWRGAKVAYVFIAMCLFPVAIGGYWAYGNQVRLYFLPSQDLKTIYTSLLKHNFLNAADAFGRNAQCTIRIPQPWYSQRTSRTYISSSGVQLLEQLPDILNACIRQFWGRLHQPNQQALLYLGPLRFQSVLRICLPTHRCGASILVEPCRSVRRDDSSGHVRVPMFHVGPHQEANQVQLQLVFQLDSGLVGDCLQLGLLHWRHLEHGG